MSETLIKVRALKTLQGDNAIYSFFINGQDIFKVADISRISRDESGQLRGLQRKPIQRHIASIIEYLKQDKILFPNAIILALDPIVEFKQSRGPVPEGVTNTSDPGVLELPILPEGKRVAWIVDGQQFNFPPNNIALQNIREVKVYESLAETNKWGQLGRAGVVEIITLNAIK